MSKDPTDDLRTLTKTLRRFLFLPRERRGTGGGWVVGGGERAGVGPTRCRPVNY